MAHNKVYAYCENFCKEETMTKEQIEQELDNKANASDVYTKAEVIAKENIAVIQFDNSEERIWESKVFHINYPEGFNKNNSIVIARTFKTDDSEFGSEFWYGDAIPDKDDMHFIGVELDTNDILVDVWFGGSVATLAGKLHVKIVLLKIS